MRPTICHFVTILIILFCCSTCFGKKNSHAKKPAPTAPYNTQKQFLNIEIFGAKADGKSDNSQVFYMNQQSFIYTYIY